MPKRDKKTNLDRFEANINSRASYKSLEVKANELLNTFKRIIALRIKNGETLTQIPIRKKDYVNEVLTPTTLWLETFKPVSDKNVLHVCKKFQRSIDSSISVFL